MVAAVGWSSTAIKTTVHALPEGKSKFNKTQLASLGREALNTAPDPEAEIVYYTDGSVDPHTNTSAAAFTHEETTVHYRLPDGSLTLQT